MSHLHVPIDFRLDEDWNRPPDLPRSVDFNDTVPTARLLDWPDVPSAGGNAAHAACVPVRSMPRLHLCLPDLTLSEQG